MPKQYQDKELLKCIIDTLKKLRKDTKVTLEHFYIDIGIHLARIEQGKTNITITTLSKICNYFEITLEYFFKNYFF